MGYEGIYGRSGRRWWWCEKGAEETNARVKLTAFEFQSPRVFKRAEANETFLMARR